MKRAVSDSIVPAVGSWPISNAAKYSSMKCFAVNWSSPLQRGVHETSPTPVKPSSVSIRTSRNGDVVCVPPRPDLIASHGLIGTRTGMVSTRAIFIGRSPRKHLHRVLEPEPQEERVDRQDDPDE